MSSNRRVLHKSQRAEQESTESARNRFLRELENYASDDDDGNDDNINNSRYNNTNHCQEHEIKTFTSMFDEVESNDDEERQPRTKIQRLESHDSESPNVALHVGRGLLQQMHQSSTSRNTHSVPLSSSSLSSHQQEKPEKLQQMHIFPQEQRQLEVVDAYVPLSTGGFLNNADAMDCVASMKVGDVVCLRESNSNGAKCKETDSASHKNEKCKAETEKNTCTENNEQASPTSRIVPSAPSLSSSMSTLTSITSTTLHHFRSESELSTREREYGVEPTIAMMQQMAQITRLDKRRREAEICFIDDRRQKISLFNLRPAGFVERELFAQWKQNPSSRPVPIIHSSTKDESNKNNSISSATIINATSNATSEVSTKRETESISKSSPSKEAETLPW